MRLEINCEDRLGIAQDVLDILVNRQIDLRGIEVDAIGKIFVSFPNLDFHELQTLMPEIRRIPGVEDVKTTAFLPMEREQNQLKALVHTLPDPVFSIDTKGRVLLANDAALRSLESDADTVVGEDISELVRGFNFHRWLNAKDVNPLAHKIKFIEQDYLADIMPVWVAEELQESVLAGALILLKSEYRLGQQLDVFHQIETEQFNHIQARSPAMKKLIKDAKKQAELDGPIVIYGESGVGVSMLAKACHNASRRAAAKFVTCQCAAVDAAEIDALLFGHEKSSESGLIRQAEGGSLLLKDVDALPLSTQAKLLQLLQQGMVWRAGTALSADVRILCSTHVDLQQRVADQRFREDFYYHINALSLLMPALRERKADIVPLAEMYLQQHSAKLNRQPPKLNKSCVEYLQSYPWPGNVRQLENALYRAVALVEGSELSKDDIRLPECEQAFSYAPQELDGSLDDEVKKFERDLLRRLYPSYPSTRQLARKLGLSHTAIANKLREYGISRKTLKV